MREKSGGVELSRKGFVSNYPHFRYWKKPAVEEMLMEGPINIYVHVPFCAQKCAYCYYKTEKYKSPEQLKEFVDALCREIPMANEQFHLSKRPVHSIYIGGGTPSLLKEEMLQQLVESLKENFNIKEPEFTIEAEPRTITEKKIRAYKDMGITRVSIGVQSFCDEIIKLSGRLHSGEKALKAIDIVKKAGDQVINIDLLSGLAGETDETWLKSIDTAINTGVHNITVYRMEVYLNTEFFSKSVRKKLIELPSEEKELHFMELALERFNASDYKPWSFFTFTRGGEFHHHYAEQLWKGEDCCAFGPSAFGMLGRFHYQNTLFPDKYLSSLEQGQLPMVRGHKLTGKDMMIKDILMGMKLARFNRSDFRETHGFDLCSVIPDTVEQLKADGFIQLDEHAVTLAPRGILYGDYAGKRLAHALKQYLGLDELSLY
jgi:oxygen-independent coproporphyrinogen-3 oxidase